MLARKIPNATRRSPASSGCCWPCGGRARFFLIRAGVFGRRRPARFFRRAMCADFVPVVCLPPFGARRGRTASPRGGRGGRSERRDCVPGWLGGRDATGPLDATRSVELGGGLVRRSRSPFARRHYAASEVGLPAPPSSHDRHVPRSGSAGVAPPLPAGDHVLQRPKPQRERPSIAMAVSNAFPC